MPEKFDLTYINEENEKVRPVIIHRAVFGSIDRFLGILIEHFGGAFRLWLVPKQVQVIGVAEVHADYVEHVASQLRQANIRVAIDKRNEKLGRKIRDAQVQKIPYVLVLGDQELQNKTVTVRTYKQESLTTLPIHELLEQIQQEIIEKQLPL